MMDMDDPLSQAALICFPDLDAMSIEQLQDYITTLEAEVVRVHGVIENKVSARQAAETLFRSGGGLTRVRLNKKRGRGLCSRVNRRW
ncbi:DUF1192 domain-containing protein [Haematospirillum jordaniae]|nr:DUF1192 domain-containing protein [Haematospirillum jordaniae]NKD91198.1 DUF1192 domain-containing protein [Haematospirillum jordaniae]